MTALLDEMSSPIRIKVCLLAMVPNDKNVNQQNKRTDLVKQAPGVVIRMLQHPQRSREPLVLSIDVSVHLRVQFPAPVELEIAFVKAKQSPGRVVDIRVLGRWD